MSSHYQDESDAQTKKIYFPLISRNALFAESDRLIANEAKVSARAGNFWAARIPSTSTQAAGLFSEEESAEIEMVNVFWDPYYMIDITSKLLSQNSILAREIEKLKERLNQLESNLEVANITSVEGKEISDEEAKEQIINLFSRSKTLYYSDIAKETGIDLQTVVKICQQLIESGAIDIDADLYKPR